MSVPDRCSSDGKEIIKRIQRSRETFLLQSVKFSSSAPCNKQDIECLQELVKLLEIMARLKDNSWRMIFRKRNILVNQNLSKTALAYVGDTEPSCIPFIL